MGNGHLKAKVDALALDVEGLLKLLGGTPEQRERYWEILKGITSRAWLNVVEAEVGAAQANVKSVANVVAALHDNAKQLSAGD